MNAFEHAINPIGFNSSFQHLLRRYMAYPYGLQLD